MKYIQARLEVPNNVAEALRKRDFVAVSTRTRKKRKGKRKASAKATGGRRRTPPRDSRGRFLKRGRR